jgi:hypothetical protein
MSYFKHLKRFLAGVVAVTFFATNTLTPAPAAHAQTVENFPEFFNENSFRIPAELGKVTDILKSPEGGPLLIHIQEAHANYDAQKNIKDILQLLSKDYGVKLILLEGAGNKLQPELFNFFPKDAELQQAVNEKLMRVGELTGAEVFLIDNDQENRDASLETRDSKKRGTQTNPEVRVPRPATHAQAWGIENAQAYAKDRESYRKVYENRETLDRFLNNFYLEWQKEASLRLNPGLREFLTRYAGYEEGTVTLESWLEMLKKSSATTLHKDLTDVKEQIEWPTLVRYFRLRALDGKIDGKKAEEEKAKFFNFLRGTGNAERFRSPPDISRGGSSEHVPEVLFKEIETAFESAKRHNPPIYKTRFVFERLMDTLPDNFSFAAYPNLRLYIQQMILMSELQSETLQSEIKKLTAALVESLVKTDDERTLARTLREYQLLKKLFHLELSREEYQQLRSRQIDPERLSWGLVARDSGLVKSKKTRGEFRGTSPAPEIHELRQEAMNFYSGAIIREDFMMKRAREVMAERKETKAVLITGGFHTDGFKQKITASGSSYIGITPAIGEVTKEEQKNYLSALLGTNGTWDS